MHGHTDEQRPERLDRRRAPNLTNPLWFCGSFT